MILWAGAGEVGASSKPQRNLKLQNLQGSIICQPGNDFGRVTPHGMRGSHKVILVQCGATPVRLKIMKPCLMGAPSGFAAGVMLLGVGGIMALGADYPGMAGALPMLSASVRPVSVFDESTGRSATFSPDLYYHLALGSMGAGEWSGLTKAIDAKGFSVQPPGAAGQHFRSSMQPGSTFNWGHASPAFSMGVFHFHSPVKTLSSAAVASQAQPGPTQYPNVPTLNQKAPGPNHIIDDPKNALEHRLP